MNIYPRDLILWKFGLFVLANFGVIVVVLSRLNKGQSNVDSMTVVALTEAFVIVLAEYPLLLRNSSWAYRSFIFYVGFLVFCFVLNFSDVLRRTTELHEPAAWLGLFGRGLLFVVFGHIVGAIYIPLVILMNWLGKRVFF